MKEEKKNRPVNLLIFILLGGGYCFCAAEIFLSPSLVRWSAGMLLGWSLLFITAAGIIFYNRFTLMISGSLFLLALTVGAFRLHLQGKLPFALQEASGEIRAVLGQIVGTMPYRTQNNTGIFFCVLFFLTLFCILFLYRRIFVLPPGLLLLAGYLLWLFSGKQVRAFPIILGFLCFFILFVLKIYQDTARRFRLSGLRTGSVAVCALLLSASAFVIAGIIPPPAGSGVGGLSAAAGKYISVADFFQSLNFQSALLQKSGFSADLTPLGGNFRLDGTPVMEVSAEKPVYLVGTTCNVYRGTSWTSTFQETEMSSERLTLPGKRELLDSRQTVRINPLVSGNVLFYPYYSSRFTLPDNQRILSSAAGLFKVAPILLPGKSYSVELYPLKKERETYEILKTLPSVPEERAGELGKQGETYFELPGSIPERVYELADYITEECESDYEKAAAIERYLATHYKYSLTPGVTPTGAEFTDYFLFEQRRGYCSYYATAMAVLSRCVGLPSRYVKGYVTPARKNEKGVFLVTESTSHAWTEVYFSEVGWVPFEPTPPFNDETEGNPDVLADDARNSAYRDYFSALGLEDTVSSGESGPASSSSAATSESPAAVSSAPEGDREPVPGYKEPGETDMSESGTRLFTAILLSLLAVCVCLFFFLRFARSLTRLRRVRRSKGNGRAIFLFEEILRIAAYCGDPVKKGETAIAFARRISGKEIYRNVDLRPAASIYTGALFDREPCSPEQLTQIEEIYEKLLQSVKGGMSGFRFRYLRYFRNLL